MMQDATTKIDSEYGRAFATDFLSWVEANLDRALNMDDVEARTGYSRWYIQRRFKAFTGMSLIHYIRCRRLSLAAQLIKSTNRAINDIYVTIGYKEPSVFNRAFRRQFGVSPSQYRLMDDPLMDKQMPALAVDDMMPESY